MKGPDHNARMMLASAIAAFSAVPAMAQEPATPDFFSESISDWSLSDAAPNPLYHKIDELNISFEPTEKGIERFRKMLYEFHLNLAELGGYPHSSERMHAYADKLERKLNDATLLIRAHLGHLTHTGNSRSVSHLNDAAALCSQFIDQIQRFKRGGANFYVRVAPEVDVVLEPLDVRSYHAMRGADESIRAYLRKNPRYEPLAYDYSTRGLLDKFKDYVLSPATPIPFEEADRFIRRFDDDDKITLDWVLRSASTARALYWAGNSTERGTRMQLIEHILKAHIDGLGNPSYHIDELRKRRPDLADLLRADSPLLNLALLAPGATSDEKVRIIAEYAALNLGASDIAHALSLPSATPQDLQAVAQRYRVTAATALAVLRSGIDTKLMNDLSALYPDDDRSDRSAKNILTAWEHSDTATRQRLPTILKELRRYSDSIPPWYLLRSIVHDSIDLDAVGVMMASLKGAGPAYAHLENAIALARHKIEPSYATRMISVLGRFDPVFIATAFDEHLGIEALERAKQELDADLFARITDHISLFRHYETRLASSPERIIRFKAIVAGLSRPPGEIRYAMHFAEGHIDLDLARFALENNLADDARLIAEYGMLPLLRKLSSTGLWFEHDSVQMVLAIRAFGATDEDIAQYVRSGHTLKFVLDALRANDSPGNYDVYARVLRNVAYEDTALLGFFHVDPDNLPAYGINEHSLSIRDRIDTIIRTELARGRLGIEDATFLNTFGISFPSRYPVEILRNMRDLYGSPDRQHMPEALVILAKNDHNGAFDGRPALYGTLLKGYNVYVAEVGSDEEFIARVERFSRRTEERGVRGLVLVGGHGSEDGINFAHSFAESATLGIDDIEKMKRIKLQHPERLSFVLQSCSTGKGGADANNIASVLSRTLGGVSVYAPEAPANISSFAFNPDSTVHGVNYTGNVKSYKIAIGSQK